MDNVFQLTETIQNSSYIKYIKTLNDEKIVGDLGNIETDEEGNETFNTTYGNAVINTSDIIDYQEPEGE